MTHVWSEIQRNTAKYSQIPYRTPYSKVAHPVGSSIAHVAGDHAGRAGEEAADHRLASPVQAAHQQHNFEANLVRGHEAAICLVDAGRYVCLCCPAPLHNNGMFKTGPTFSNVLCHIYGKQHVPVACAARWVKVKYLMRRLRLFARVAGRVLLWRARAADRAYAPGGRGFNEAQTNFQLHASSCV